MICPTMMRKVSRTSISSKIGTVELKDCCTQTRKHAATFWLKLFTLRGLAANSVSSFKTVMIRRLASFLLYVNGTDRTVI